MGEEAEEGAVELGVELAALVGDKLRGADRAQQFVRAATLGELHQAAAVVVKLVDIDGAAVDVLGDVFLFDGVGLKEGAVDVGEGVVGGLQTGVGVGEGAAGLAEALHLSVDVQEAEDEAGGQKDAAQEQSDDGALLAVATDAVSAINDGVDLGRLHDACSGVAGAGVLEGALHVVVGAVNVAVLVEQEGQLAQRDVFADRESEVSLGRQGQVTLLPLVVAQPAVSVGQGIGQEAHDGGLAAGVGHGLEQTDGFGRSAAGNELVGADDAMVDVRGGDDGEERVAVTVGAEEVFAAFVGGQGIACHVSVEGAEVVEVGLK